MLCSLLSRSLLSLCTALKSNSSLKLLNLSNNLIGPEGSSKLVDALKANDVLTSLDVSSNKLGQDGALHFANLLVVKWEKVCPLLPPAGTSRF